MKRVIWHFPWNNGHYLEWYDGERTHLSFMSDEEYEDIIFDIECV